jgi:hypothetical protein
MAELNFGLLTPPGSQSIGNAFVTGMDQGQEARARDLQMQQSMRQGQMAELQYKKAQDAETKLNQFYAHVADNGGPQDPVAIENQMIGSGIPQVANTGLSARMARLKVEQDRKLYAAANAPAAPMPTGGTANMLPGVVQPAPTGGTANMLPGATQVALAAPPQVRSQIAALNNRIAANMSLGTEQGYKTADLLQKQVTELSKLYTVGNALMGSEGQIVGTAPAAVPPPRQPNLATDLLIPGPNGTMVPNTALVNVQTGLRQAGRAPAQPRPEQPPVSVVDPDTGRQILVSRDEAITRRMTPANAAEGLAPKEIQRREATFPKATAAVKAFEVSADSLVKDLETLAVHPGLDSITGLLAGRIIGLTSEGRAAKALYDKIVARGGFQELQNVRVASPTGGGLGNVSNQEGTQLKNAFAAVDRTQDASDVRAALTRAAEETKASKGRVREAYELTYEYRPSLKPAGADKPALSPADREALDWAAANPKDPRAAQIRQKNGVK